MIPTNDAPVAIDSRFMATNDQDITYIGIKFCGGAQRKFFQITCPCGVTAEYPLNGFPAVDTPHPCGNPKHWVAKYSD